MKTTVAALIIFTISINCFGRTLCPQVLPSGLSSLTGSGFAYNFELKGQQFKLGSIENVGPDGASQPMPNSKFTKKLAKQLYQKNMGKLPPTTRHAQMCSTYQGCTCQYNIAENGPIVLLTEHPSPFK